jgi:hypothetical protein
MDILVLYAAVSWVIVSYYVTCIEKKRVVKSILIYMIISIVTLSVASVLSINLELFVLTKDVKGYIALTLYRNIIMLILLLIFISKLDSITTYPKKIGSFILMLSLLSIFEFINIKFRLYKYVKWSFFLSIVVYCSFIFLTIGISKLIDAIEKWGEDKK